MKDEILKSLPEVLQKHCSTLKKTSNANYNYIFEHAKVEQKLFDVDKLEGYLLKETHTFTKEMFEEKFVKRIELVEHIEGANISDVLN